MRLPELSYRAGSSWRPLSDWMRFFFDVGRYLVEVQAPGARLTVGVTVPTRAYAAVLAGAGVVLARAELEYGPSRSAARHFEYLVSLPPNTSVIWHTPTGKKKAGWLAGVREYQGRRVLMIQTSMKGGLKESCDVRDCLGVQPIGVDVTLRPGNEKGKPLGPTVPFLSSLVPKASLFRLLSESSADCLIHGIRRQLVAEADLGELAISIPAEARVRKGTIGSILRLRDPRRPTETFRAMVAGDPRDIEGPAVLIYDGPRAYLKWRHRWPYEPSLLILDRSDPRARDGAETMNEEYVTKRISEWEPPPIDLPDGVEMTAYMVGVRR
jgi:hypothetical protein